MGGVEVLDDDHLEAGGAALAGGDDGPGEEELPDAVPLLAVLCVDGLGVAEPVTVPAPEGARVVDADGVDALDLPAGALEAADVVGERGGGVGAGEDVLVEVKTPDEVLVLPGLAETRELDVHGAVVLEHVVALAEEGGESANTDVLAHLELGDLVELLGGDVAVVHAEDLALALGDAGAAEAVVTPGGLVAGNGGPGNLGSVVDTGELGEGAPSAANIQHGLALLQAELLANDGHLVVLHLLECLLAAEVGEETTGVDHAGTEEVGVVVVTLVVGGLDLVLILLAGVEDDIGSELEEDEAEQGVGEGEVGPVVAVLEGVKEVAVDVDEALGVELSESLDGDLVAAAVLLAILLVLESEVVLDGAAGELGLVVDAGREP